MRRRVGGEEAGVARPQLPLQNGSGGIDNLLQEDKVWLFQENGLQYTCCTLL